MSAFNTLFPVFFMLALGFACKKFQWITPEQKNGVNALVFKILFPVMIFNLVASADFQMDHIQVFLYVTAVFILAVFVGRWLTPKLTGKYAHFAPYMCSTLEGASVGLPLYLSIVGSSSNTVIFDISGSLVAFILFPIMIAKQTAGNADAKTILKNICSNSFVLAVAAGLIANFTGIYSMVMSSAFGPSLQTILNHLTEPIMPVILLILGYDFTINKKILVPVLKLMVVKTVYFAIVIAGFFVFFPHLMADKTYMMAPIIYFMCPTGFGLMPLLEPLYADEDDAAFASAFMSMYILVSLAVYTFVVIFIA